MEPHFDGPFKISGRNIDSGNYLLQTLEGENLKSSYPRWKLKPTADSTKLISLNDETSNKKPINDELNSLKTTTNASPFWKKPPKKSTVNGLSGCAFRDGKRPFSTKASPMAGRL